MTCNPRALAEPIGHFDHAVLIGNILHVSCLSALSHIPGPLGKRELPASIEDQARLTYENLRKVMDAAGGDLSDVFRLVVFYVRVEDWAVVDKVTREFLPTGGFVRTGFLTELLNPRMLIAIEASALLD
jgi:2-iminobutanoate/2-iminopropanoate deaminase